MLLASLEERSYKAHDAWSGHYLAYGKLGWSDPASPTFDKGLALLLRKIRETLKMVGAITTTEEPDAFVNLCSTNQLFNKHPWHVDGKGGPRKVTAGYVIERVEGDPAQFDGAVVKFYTQGPEKFDVQLKRFRQGGRGATQFGYTESYVARDNSVYSFPGGLVPHTVGSFKWNPTSGWRRGAREFLREWRAQIKVRDIVMAQYNERGWFRASVEGVEGAGDMLKVRVTKRTGGCEEWDVSVGEVFPTPDVLGSSPAEPCLGTRFSVVFHFNVIAAKQADLVKACPK